MRLIFSARGSCCHDLSQLSYRTKQQNSLKRPNIIIAQKQFFEKPIFSPVKPKKSKYQEETKSPISAY